MWFRSLIATIGVTIEGVRLEREEERGGEDKGNKDTMITVQ